MNKENEVLDNDILEITNDVDVQQIISLNKFIFLSVVSFGTYEIWWIYKAWKFYQQKEKLDIIPAARAIFAIFFLNSLFVKSLEFAKEKGYQGNYSSISLCVGFFVVNALYRLPDPFWLISIMSFVFLIPPFKALNFAKMNSDDLIVNEQISYSSRQIILIVIGTIFWALVLFGMTLK